MSDAAFEVGPPSSLAWLKPRLVGLFGREPALASSLVADRPPWNAEDEVLSSEVARRLAGHVVRTSISLAVRASVSLAVLVAAAVVVALVISHLPSAPPSPPAPPPAAWREIVKPVRIYNLEAPLLRGAALDYTARRHTFGGREDVLTLGTLDGDKPALRLRIFRRADEAPLQVPLFAALAHEAAQVGLAIGRSGLPDLLPTRFGRFEIADVSLARKEGAAAPCDGFRLILDKPALTITGLACGHRGAALSQADVGCLIERLDVASARDDRDLVDFFAGSELRRNAVCAGARMGPDGLHAAWLDDKPDATASAKVVARDDKQVTRRKRLRRR